MRYEVQQRDKIKVFAEIVFVGVGQTGLSPTALLKRTADGMYWDGAAWQISAVTNNMSEVDGTNQPGLYVLELDPSGVDPVLGASGYEALVVESTANIRENIRIDVAEEITTDPIEPQEGTPSATQVSSHQFLQAGTMARINVAVQFEPPVSGKVGAVLVTGDGLTATVGASVVDLTALPSYQMPIFVELGRRDLTVVLMSVIGSPTPDLAGGPGGEDVMRVPVDDSSPYSVGDYVRAQNKLGGGQIYEIVEIASGTEVAIHAKNDLVTAPFDVINGDSLERVIPTGVYSAYVEFATDELLSADDPLAQLVVNVATVGGTIGYNGPQFLAVYNVNFIRTLELDLGGRSFRTG